MQLSQRMGGLGRGTLDLAHIYPQSCIHRSTACADTVLLLEPAQIYEQKTANQRANRCGSELDHDSISAKMVMSH